MLIKIGIEVLTLVCYNRYNKKVFFMLLFEKLAQKKKLNTIELSRGGGLNYGIQFEFQCNVGLFEKRGI